jgi:putative restriction endonuclease
MPAHAERLDLSLAAACHDAVDAGLLDRQVRLRAFQFLAELTSVHGEVLPWAVLLRGFEFNGQRVPLISQQGIFKPAVLSQVPLSIRTAAVAAGDPRPYEDGMDSDGLLNYRYRGTDPNHRENVGLRLAMERRAPLIYLFGIIEGQYLPVWPVYIVGDHPDELCFKVSVDDRQLGIVEAGATPVAAEARRGYVTRLTVQRLHQASFRQRVLHAYQDQCAICRLKRTELLEAAHILPDTDPRGEPIVPNGLALCTLHHAAFDRQIVGVRPDLKIEVRRDILEEIDGPMLRHGLQEIDGCKLLVPRNENLRPRLEFLEARYDLFRKAC